MNGDKSGRGFAAEGIVKLYVPPCRHLRRGTNESIDRMTEREFKNVQEGSTKTGPVALQYQFVYQRLYFWRRLCGGAYGTEVLRREKELFSEEELMDIAAISQSAPGAIAINLTALAGYRVLGWLGAGVSCMAAIIPPLLILMAVSTWYDVFVGSALVTAILKGMQGGVAALMVDLIIDMARFVAKDGSRLLTLLIPAAFVANFFCQINAAVVLVSCGMICLARLWWLQGKGGKTC